MTTRHRFTPNGTPPLTRWQRLTCKHNNREAVYTHIDQEAGDHRAYLSHYVCHTCGRKLYNPYRHRPSILLPILMFLAAAFLLIAWWWLNSH